MFKKDLEKILKLEGFYANVKGDRGGETYRGVARNFHPNWEGWQIVDKAKAFNGGSLPWNYKVNSQKLDALIENFYYKYYWQKINLSKIKDPNVRLFIFDFYVNSAGSGIKVIKTVLAKRFGKSVAIDSTLKMDSVNAINSCNGKKLFSELKSAREQFYRIIAKKGENYKFLKGWLNRLSSFEYKNTAFINFPWWGAAAILVTGYSAIIFYKQKHEYEKNKNT